MTAIKKIVVSYDNSYYYIATVNHQNRHSMSQHVSAKMESTAQNMQLSKVDLFNLLVTMRAVPQDITVLGHTYTSRELIIEEIHKYVAPEAVVQPPGPAPQPDDSSQEYDPGASYVPLSTDSDHSPTDIFDSDADTDDDTSWSDWFMPACPWI